MQIIFSGLDGAGKSTQIKELQKWLLNSGLKSSVFWARGGYTPLFLALKRLIRFSLKSQTTNPGHFAHRERVFGNPFLVRLWMQIAILDLILFWCVYLRFNKLFCRVLICDRYIDDTRLDFKRNFPAVAFEKMWFWRLLEVSLPVPDAAFLLLVPVEESLRRSRGKGDLFADDQKTLNWRLDAYLDNSLFPPNRYVRLDGRRTVSELTAEIVVKVGARLFKSACVDGN